MVKQPFDLTANDIRARGERGKAFASAMPKNYSVWTFDWMGRCCLAVIHDTDDDLAAVFDAHSYDVLHLDQKTQRGILRLVKD